MRLLVCLFALCLLCACGKSEGNLNPGKLADPELQKMIDVVETAVRDKLRDPGAAQFKYVNVFIVKDGGRSTLLSCGQVNAKNGYGGYTGFQWFYAASSDVHAPIWLVEIDGGYKTACNPDNQWSLKAALKSYALIPGTLSGRAALVADAAPEATGSSAGAAPTGVGHAAAPLQNALVLKVREDSWVDVRPAKGPTVYSGLVKGGQTKTITVTEQVILIVGKPTAVDATLRGVALALPSAPGVTVARVIIR